MDPILLIFAGIAAYFIYRLITVLGTRTGHEPRPDPESVGPLAHGNEPRDESGPEISPSAALTPVSSAAKPLRDADPQFDETAYLEGARNAYELIVEAFAAGDLRNIRRFLGDSVYEAFKTSVAERESTGQLSDLKFVGIDSAAIVESEVTENALSAVTDFTSNQVRVTRDRDGNIIDGDPNRIDLVKDRWTFSRRLSSKDPNWVLVATGAAV